MTRGRTRLLRAVLLIGVPVAVLVGGAAIWQAGGRYVNTENAYVKADIAQAPAPEQPARTESDEPKVVKLDTFRRH